MTADSPALRIRLFASLREAAGWGEMSWPVTAEAGLTPRQLWVALDLPGDPAVMRIAVNQQFAALETRLQAGDELAFLPPISGG